MCFRYGLAIPMWWGAGLCFQIALMAVLGIQTKLKIPFAHTSLEIIKLRYGKLGHIVFTVFNLVNNISGCSAMILSGSQLVIGITGMNYVAATLILPFGVIIYTIVGGLKATFLTDYLHTTIALILIIYFTLSVLVNENIGGVYGLYDKLQATAHLHLVPGNYQGSLLTMKSPDAIMWGLTLKFGNLALVVMDTAFWQKSFASKPQATVPGYLLAAVSIFAIPLGLGTVIGLAGRVIESTPLSPTYPEPFSNDAINRGYVMPYVVKGLLGNGATGGILLLLFMALTSTVSSSLIAVSSILSYDGYKTYINPNASDKTMIRVSHISVLIYGLFISGYTILLNYVGANMTFYSYLLPVAACPGIFPLIFSIFSTRQSKPAAVLSPILGLICGCITWVYTTKKLYGEISMENTSNPAPGLYGSLASLFSPVVFTVIISIIRPSRFDWNEFLKVKLLVDANESDVNLEIASAEGSNNSDNEKSKENVNTENSSIAQDVESATQNQGGLIISDENPDILLEEIYDRETIQLMRWWLKIGIIALVAIILITWVIWPMPLYRNYIFSKAFFSGWVTVAIIWQFQALLTVGVYPLWDGRQSIITAVRGIVNHIKRRKD